MCLGFFLSLSSKYFFCMWEGGGGQLQQREDKKADVYWFRCPDSQGMNKTDK